MSKKRLDFTDRCLIEKGLTLGYSFRQIAANLGCSPSSVMREIRNNRFWVTSSKTKCTLYSECIKRKICGNSTCFMPCKTCSKHDCHEYCSDFNPYHCSSLDNAPYVCNNCEKRNYCSKEQSVYSAHRADSISRERISSVRQQLHISNEKAAELNSILEPLISNGQSINHIFSTHKNEIGVSKKTVYNYIDRCVFNFRNIDLPRKVRYKKRRIIRPKNNNYKFRVNRTYEDFKIFMENHPDLGLVEMDTVKGKREKGKCLLTMIFTEYDFMLAFLIDSASQECVHRLFEYLNDQLGYDIFKRLFPVILTDNGGEFANPKSLEYTDYGMQRTNIFYCNPMASWQKPHIERNHEFIRQIIPKGLSMDKLNQDDITLMINHINSVSRDSLNGLCPYDAAKGALGRKVIKLLNLKKIPPDSVMLKPSLIFR